MQQTCDNLKEANDTFLNWVDGQDESVRLPLDIGLRIIELVYTAKCHLITTVQITDAQRGDISMRIEQLLNDLRYHLISSESPGSSPVDIIESQLRVTLEACQNA